MRKQLLGLSLFLAVFASSSTAQHPGANSHFLDLKSVGYPQQNCKWTWPPGIRIEFLDSAHLLVSFPLDSSPCKGEIPPASEKRRTAIVDVSGRILHVFDTQPGQLVCAGPNGHALLLTEKGISVLDADFSQVQVLSWPKEADTSRVPFWAWANKSISLAPSRSGFEIQISLYPDYGVAYFDGNPLKLAMSVHSCFPTAIVTDGGFACFEQSPQSKLAIHLVDGGWELHDARLEKAEWIAVPSSDQVLMLTTKFRLYKFTRSGAVSELANLSWLAPGLYNPGITYGVSSSAAHRILVSSWGTWFPINDTTGIGYYERIAVVDYSTGTVIFKRKYSIGTSVVISPDGRWLAAREKNRLSLVALP